MGKIEKTLTKVAFFQERHAVGITLVALLFAGLGAVGATGLTWESDFMKLIPQDIPSIQLMKDVRSEFGGIEEYAVVITLENRQGAPNAVKDVRSPQFIQMLDRIERNILVEQGVTSVVSLATIIKQRFGEIPQNPFIIRETLKQDPMASYLMNSDYSVTLIRIKTDIRGYEHVKRFVRALKQDVMEAGLLPGVNIYVTGENAQGADILDQMGLDLRKTVLVAATLILLILTLVFLSPFKAFLPLAPLGFSLTWTAGTMRLLGIPINLMTVSIGVLIIGLGIEYGVFITNAYYERRKLGENIKTSVSYAVSHVGRGIFGSSSTTMAGFLAMTTAGIPGLRQLGLVLSIGIFYAMVAAVFVCPAILVVGDEHFSQRKKMVGSHDKEDTPWKHLLARLEFLPRLQARHPLLVLAMVLLVTLLLAGGLPLLRVETGFHDMGLPKKFESVRGMEIIEDEFGGLTNIMVVVRTDGRGVIDLRNPEAMRYVDRLSILLAGEEGIGRVASVSQTIKKANNGVIPDDQTRIERILTNLGGAGLGIDKGYRLTYITADVTVGDDEEQITDLASRTTTLVERSTPPPGIKADPTGVPIVIEDLRRLIDKDLPRVNLIGTMGVLVCVVATFVSIVLGLLTLVPVGLGTLWTIGSMGYLGWPITTRLVGLISMILGVGIDQAIQYVTRFKFEIEKNNLEEALVNTFHGVSKPIVSTTIAAVTGFLGLLVAELEMMHDLGKTMALGLSYVMVITLLSVPAFLALYHRSTPNKEST